MTIIDLESASAKVTFDQLQDFKWYLYEGRNRKKFTGRRNVMELKKGELFGLKKLKTGNFYIVHADTWKHQYRIQPNEAASLERQSKPKRGVPKEVKDVDMTGRKRAPRQATNKRKLDPSASRFNSGKRIKEEAKNGIDFKNYQWRKLGVAQFRVAKTAKKGIELERGEMFGIRFAKPSEGGYIVMQDGRRQRIRQMERYDELVESSTLLPLNKWPKDVLSAEEVKNLLTQREDNIKRKQQQARKDLLEKKRAKQAEEKRRRQQKKAEEREAQRLKVLELEEKAKGEVKTIQAPVRQVGADELLSERRPKEDDLVKEIDEMGVDDDDFDLDFDDIDEDNEFPDEDETDEIPEEEIVDPDMDAKNVEAALDSEIERVRQDARKIQIVDEDEEDDELDLEDEDALDIDDDEDDEDEEQLSLEEENQQAAEDEALDQADYDGDDESIPDEDFDDEDTDMEEDAEDVDDNQDTDEESEDDSDGDEAESSEEDAEEEDEPFEEADVIQFHADETDQREFVILDVRPLRDGPIMVYEVYDIEADSGEYHTIRVNPKNKGGIEKMAKHVRKMNAKEFAKIFNQKESYTRTKEPIAS